MSVAKVERSKILLGTVDSRNELGVSLHRAAMINSKSKLKRLLDQGVSISVDYPNSLGQTPLFCACAVSSEITASFLLQHGADPNIKDCNGITPVHVVCSTGNIRLLCDMIKEGGNVCLTDNQGQGVMDWANKNEDVEARTAMMAFLDQMDNGRILSSTENSRQMKNTSKKKLGLKESGSDMKLAGCKSAGFGQVHPFARESSAIVSVVPLISKTMLKNVDKESYCCSLDFTMKEMLWHVTEVSVKTLRSEFEDKEQLNLIVSEASFLSKLHHPNVLTLMALRQPLALVFEKVHKNIYHCLHNDDISLPPDLCVTLAIQICSAMGYIHDQGFIHCTLSSHAVYLANNVTVKLGNFEFMVESSQASKGLQSTITSQKNVQELYHWMAPEIIRGNSPVFSNDFFSFCCLLWEMFKSKIPWCGMSGQTLYEAAFSTSGPAPLPMDGLPQEIGTIIYRGLHRHEDQVLNFDSAYSFLKDFKQKYWLDRSYNSISKDAPLSTSGQSSSEDKRVLQDKLVFTSRTLHARGRSFQSTSAIFSATSSNQRDKNCSEGDLHSFQHQNLHSTSTSPMAIKPASHHLHQSAPVCVTRPSTSVVRPSTVSDDRRIYCTDCVQKNSREELQVKQMPCSVRQLADDYQQIIVQHKLRQEILKGSMAPHGGCESTDSPLNSTRWHSLPSTIRELSKTWSPDEETAKTGLLELANMSCTPQVKQTSTPLRRGMEGSVGASSLGDFFRRQGKRRNIRTSCDNENLVGDSEYKSTKLKAADVMEEMKLVQSQWKRRITVEDEEEASIMGISYHSPIIQVKRGSSSVPGDINHTLLQTSDDSNSIGSSLHSPTNENVQVIEDEQLHNKTVNDSLQNFRYNLRNKRLSPTRTKISFTLDDSDAVCIDGTKTDACVNMMDDADCTNLRKKDIVSGADGNSDCLVKDSFWDVTTQWSKVGDNPDNCVDAGHGERKDQKQEESGQLVYTNADQHMEDDCVNVDTDDDYERMVDSAKHMDIGGKDKDGEDDVKNTTFSIPNEGIACLDKKDLNMTFTVDADITEPDSWFPDTAPTKGPIPQDILSQMNDSRTKETDNKRGEDEALPSDDHSHIVEEMVNRFGEFEIREFYIDDEFDTSEGIQPSNSIQPRDSHDCLRSDDEEEVPLQYLPLPPSRHNSDASQNVINDNVTDKSLQADQSLCEQEPRSTVERKISRCFSYPCQVDKEITGSVQERISQFGGLLKESRSVITNFQQSYPLLGRHDSLLCEQEKSSASFGIGKDISVDICDGRTHLKNGRKNMVEKKESEPGKGKSRIIPKIREKEISTNTNLLSRQETTDGMCLTESVKDDSGDYQSHYDHLECQKMSCQDIVQPVLEFQMTNGDCEKKMFGEGEINGSSTVSYSYEKESGDKTDSVKCKGRADNDYDDSDDWLSERLQCVQSKIRRRRQRDVYTISSDEEVNEEFVSPLSSCRSQGWREVRRYDFDFWKEDQNIKDNFKTNTHLDDFESNATSQCNTVRNKTVSVSSSERLSLPQKMNLSSFSKWSFMNSNNLPDDGNCESETFNQFELPEDTNDKGNFVKYCQNKRSWNHDVKRKNQVLPSNDLFDDTKRKSKSQRSDNTSQDSFYKKSKKSNHSRETQPRPRSIGNVRSNESRSTLRTVMFEDETDGLRQFSPTAISKEVITDNIGVMPCGMIGPDFVEEQEYKDCCDAVVEEGRHHSSNSWIGRGCDLPSRDYQRLDETFNVVQGEKVNDGGLMCGGDMDVGAHGVWEEKGGGEGCKEGGDQISQPCLILGLRHDQDYPGACRREKVCTIGDNVYTEVHRFYIPKSQWPDGCKTRLNVDLSPNNPRRHKISTIATDPVSGRKEVLMEKNVETDRLQSHLSLD